MARFLFLCLWLVPAAVGWMMPVCRAQDPAELLDHYKLVPRLSTLDESGHFDLSYRLLGKYDFRHGSGWTAAASFENAEIWGSIISDGPTPAFVIDVDQILNLEGLTGEALPVAAPFDVFKFTGKSGNGSSVQLFAAVIGPWMYLHGGTVRPAASTTLAEYQLRAVARSRPFADFNGDGVVDAADYTIMRDKGALAGAASSDDLTAGAGYAEWKEQFGETIPDFVAVDGMLSAAAAGFGTASATAAPEPGSLGIVVLGGLILACRRRVRT